MRWFVRTVAASTLLFGSIAYAETTKDMSPLMTVRGKQLLADDFSSPTLDSKWKVAKGKWEVVDGALKGVEVAADMHAAAIRTDLKHTNAIYQFDFRFDGGKTAHLSINGGKGHICRVTITPEGFQVRKDGTKESAEDKAVLLDSCKMSFEKGKWYTMLVEVQGKEILARVDDKHFAFGQDAKVESAKTNFGFPAAGDATCFDNVKVWEATANPEWEKTREKLKADHPEKMGGAKAPAKAAAK